MLMIEFIFYFLACAFALSWLAARLLGRRYTEEGAKLQRPASAAIVVIALAFAYLMAYEKPVHTECRPAGAAIHNDC